MNLNRSDKGGTSVCRLCIQFFTKYPQPTNYVKTLIKNVLPNLHLTLTNNPVVCVKCVNLLMTYSNFKMMCIEKEKKVQEYYGKTKNIVDLYEFLKNEKSRDTTLTRSKNNFKNLSKEPVKNTDAIKQENSQKNKENMCEVPMKNLRVIINKENLEEIKRLRDEEILINKMESDIDVDEFICKMKKLQNENNHLGSDNDTDESNPSSSKKSLKYQSALSERCQLYQKINSDQFSCLVCSKIFSQKLHLDGHLLTKHKDIPNIEKKIRSRIHYCEFCSYRTINNFNLAKHLISKHSKKNKGYKEKSEKFFCTHCKYSTENKQKLILHIKTHIE